MRTVPLHGRKAAGRVALVDDADYELVMQHRWIVLEAVYPYRIDGPYARTYQHVGGRKITILMHTLIAGWPRVDHQDGDGLNNQRGNLRPATASQNGANRRPVPGCTSQYKGVGWNSRNRNWRARIRFHGIQRQLGTFTDEVMAAKAYDAAARELFGVYARTNFPDDMAS